MNEFKINIPQPSEESLLIAKELLEDHSLDPRIRKLCIELQEIYRQSLETIAQMSRTYEVRR